MNFNRTLLMIFCVATLAGCSTQEAPKSSPNDAALKPIEVRSTETLNLQGVSAINSLSTASLDLFTSLDPQEFSRRREAQDSWFTLGSALITGSQSSPLDTLVTPLSPLILDATLFENPRDKGSAKMQQLASDFMFGLLRALKLPSEAPKAVETLSRFETVLMAGCDNALHGCRNITFFRGDNQSKDLAKQIARLHAGDSDLTLYYRALKVAFDLQNNIDDPELALLYLTQAQAYLEQLRKEPVANATQIKTHQQLLTTLLENSETLQQAPGVRTFLQSSNFWSYREQNGAENSLQQLIFDQAVGLPSSIRQSDGKLTPPLTQAIAALDDLTAAGNADSYAQTLATLQHQLPASFAPLGISEITSADKDEYYFIISSVFRERLNADRAFRIWSGTGRDVARLLKLEEQYLRLEFLRMVNVSSQSMRSFFSHGTPSADLVQKAVENSVEIGLLWKNFLKKAQALKTLTEKTLSAADKATADAHRSDIVRLFDNLPKDIKYVVEQPHIMMLTYYMSKLETGMTLHTWYTFNISPSLIVQSFFNGDIENWFNYSGETQKLSREDLLYSFYYALNTGLLESFQIDMKDLLQTFADKLLNEQTQDLRQMTVEMADTFDNSTAYHNFLNFCSTVRSGGTAKSVIDLETFIRNPLLGDNAWTAYSSPPSSSGFAIHYPTYEERIERVRVAFSQHFTVFRSMISMYEAHLKQGVTSAAEVTRKIAELNAITEHASRVSRAFMTQFFQRNQELAPCLIMLAQKEKDLWVSLLERERDHLRQIHSDMKRIRDGSATRESLAAHYGFYEYGPDYKGFDSFDGENFRYHRFDFLLRAKRNVEGGRTVDGRPVQALAPMIEVAVPTKMSETAFGEHDLVDDFRRRSGIIVPFIENEDEFVAAAFRAVQKGPAVNSAGFVDWARSYHAALAAFRRMTDTLAALYKAGPIETFDSTSSLCLTDGCPVRTQQLQAGELVQRNAEIIRAISISDRESSILKLLGIKEKYLPEDLQTWTVEMTTGAPMGFFDRQYILITSALLGDFENLPWIQVDSRVVKYRAGALVRAQDFADAKRYRGSFLYPVDPAFEAQIEGDYRKTVQLEFGQIHNFEKAVSEFPAGALELRTHTERAPQKEPYLSPVLLNNQNSKERTFNNRTGGMFGS